MTQENSRYPGLQQKMIALGFEITSLPFNDSIGAANRCMVKRDGKRTVRWARKFEDALALCAHKHGLLENGEAIALEIERHGKY